MLQRDESEDFVIATGQSNSLKEFINVVFQKAGLDWNEYIVSDPSLLRPAVLMIGRANPVKAMNVLKWTATSNMHEVTQLMVEAELGSSE